MALPPRLTPARLRAVAFDYGGTLVTFRAPLASLDRLEPDLRRALGRRRSGALPEAALAHTLDAAVEQAVARPRPAPGLRELDVRALYGAVLAQLVGPVPARVAARVVRLHQRAWFDGVTVRPGVPAMLTALRAWGLRVGLCSNAPYPVAGMHQQLRHLGLRDRFDTVVFSSGVGWRKPHPAAFAAMTRRLGVPAASILFVGDEPDTDLAGAQAAGMRARRAPRGARPDWTRLLDEVDRLRRGG